MVKRGQTIVTFKQCVCFWYMATQILQVDLKGKKAFYTLLLVGVHEQRSVSITLGFFFLNNSHM